MKTARLALSWIMATFGLLAIVFPNLTVRVMTHAYGDWLDMNHTVSQVLGIYLFWNARKVALDSSDLAALHSCSFVAFAAVTLTMSIMDNINDSNRQYMAVALLLAGTIASRLLARRLRLRSGSELDGGELKQTDSA